MKISTLGPIALIVAAVCVIAVVAFSNQQQRNPLDRTVEAAANTRHFVFADGTRFESVLTNCLAEEKDCFPKSDRCTFDIGTEKVIMACPSEGKQFGLTAVTSEEVDRFLYENAIFDADGSSCGPRWLTRSCAGSFALPQCGPHIETGSEKSTISGNVFCRPLTCTAVFRASSGTFFLQTLTPTGRSAPFEPLTRENEQTVKCR